MSARQTIFARAKGVATKRLVAVMLVGLLPLACKTPVVFHGLRTPGNGGSSSTAVSSSDLAALIRYHAREAVSAASAGRIDDARAHWEAHESLRALPNGEVVEAGVALKELASLTELLESDEIETDVEASGSGTPEALRTGQDGPSLKEHSIAAADESASEMTPPIPATPESDALENSPRNLTEVGSPPPVEPPPPSVAPPPPAVLTSKDWLQREVRRILTEFGEGRAVELPRSFLDKVERAVNDFTKGNRRLWFNRAIQRMDKYLPAIHGIFSEGRLPESFYYLALVESAFNPNARSHAGAVGLWQFMPATARRYGLTVRRGRDERRDPRKATRAAREYLLDLILEFGDGHSMLLAMAAYNAGEGRVRNRLRRLRDYRNRSFWALDQRRLLPAETRRYVPTIIAAAVVGRNRSRFGLGASRPASGVSTVVLRRPISIPYILQAAQMAKASLLALNPDLEAGTGVTPAETEFPLVLPRDVAQRLRRDPVLLAAQRAPSTPRASPKVAPPTSRTPYLTYRVQTEDSWWSISGWSGVPQEKLQKDNPALVRTGLRPGQVVYIRGAKDLRRVQHVVEPGEKITDVARTYGVAASRIQKWNQLKDGVSLRTGQRLVLYTRKSLPPASGPRRLTYTVRAKDSWWKISRWSGIDADKLRRDNPDTARVGLQPGQTIQLIEPPKNLRRVEHVVRDGETLVDLATRYGVRVEQITQWNGLPTRMLAVGRRLIIYTRLRAPPNRAS